LKLVHKISGEKVIRGLGLAIPNNMEKDKDMDMGISMDHWDREESDLIQDDIERANHLARHNRNKLASWVDRGIPKMTQTFKNFDACLRSKEKQTVLIVINTLDYLIKSLRKDL